MRPVSGPWPRWPLGLLGMIALVVVVETSVARHGDDLSHPWASDWKHGVAAVNRDAPACRLLCFGDSLTKYGVVPKVLEARLGGKAYNLALGAAPPPVTYAMLRRALDAGARPDAILVDFAPHLLGVGPEISSVLLPEVLSLADCLTLGWQTGHPALHGPLALARICPTVKDRAEIRGAIRAAFLGEDRLPRTLANTAARRNWSVNRGGHLAIRTPRGSGDDAPWAAQLYPPEWHCTPLNASYVRKFLKLAASRSIPVFWLIPPFSPEVHIRRTCAGLDARYDQYVTKVVGQFPTLTVVDARQAGYDINVHADAIHLDRRGAAVFTEEVAKVVADRLAGGAGADRWVHLPPYRDRPIDAPFEDIGQSHLAIIPETKVIRR